MVFKCMTEFLMKLRVPRLRLMKASSLQIDCLGILVRCFSFQNAPKKKSVLFQFSPPKIQMRTLVV